MEKRPIIGIEEEEGDIDFQQDNIELEVEEAIVQVIDGAIIDGDDEQIKILFYYIRPGGNVLEHDRVLCKGVASFLDVPASHSIYGKRASICRTCQTLVIRV